MEGWNSLKLNESGTQGLCKWSFFLWRTRGFLGERTLCFWFGEKNRTQRLSNVWRSHRICMEYMKSKSSRKAGKARRTWETLSGQTGPLWRERSITKRMMREIKHVALKEVNGITMMVSVIISLFIARTTRSRQTHKVNSSLATVRTWANSSNSEFRNKQRPDSLKAPVN